MLLCELAEELSLAVEPAVGPSLTRISIAAPYFSPFAASPSMPE